MFNRFRGLEPLPENILEWDIYRAEDFISDKGIFDMDTALKPHRNIKKIPENYLFRLHNFKEVTGIDCSLYYEPMPSLHVRHCPKFTGEKLPAIFRSIDIQDCSEFQGTDIPIKSLRVSDAPKFFGNDINESVESLHIGNCENFQGFNLPVNLVGLIIKNSPLPKDWPKNLEKLTILKCQDISQASLPDTLTELNLYNVTDISSLDIPSHLSSLVLDESGFISVGSIPSSLLHLKITKSLDSLPQELETLLGEIGFYKSGTTGSDVKEVIEFRRKRPLK